MAGEMNEEYQWRETYFILFPAAERPKVAQVEQALNSLSNRIVLNDLTADDEGGFESVMLQSPDDYAAVEVTYESGEAVIAQGVDLAKQLKAEAEPDQLAQLLRADARLDVMHFEQVVSDSFGDEEQDDMLDPTCLLMVVDALVALTGGIAIDPSSGAIVN